MSELALVESTLDLPGFTFRERGILIAKDTTDAKLIQAAERLSSVSAFTRWALAALLTELQDRKGETWLNAFCEARGINPKYRRELIWMHRFYPLEKRTFALDYDYYREAQHQSFNGKEFVLSIALNHLRSAAASKWSVGEMRRAIRSEAATQPNATPDAELSDYAAIHSIARYAHSQLPSISTWTPTRARLVLTDLRETEEFIARLHAISRL